MADDQFDISDDISVASANIGWDQLVFLQLRWCNYFKTISRSGFTYDERLRAANVLEDSIETMENMFDVYKPEGKEDEGEKSETPEMITEEERERLTNTKSEVEIQEIELKREREYNLSVRFRDLNARLKNLYHLVFALKLSPEKTEHSNIKGV